MVEEQRKRVEDEMTRLVEGIEGSHLRKMQSDMHKCAANCYDNQDYSARRAANCVENCTTTVNRAQEYITKEMERVQNRLQRCVMDCNDKIRDKMDPTGSQAEIDKYTNEFEKCSTICVDNYCDMMPSLGKSIKKVLSSGKFD